MCGPARCCCLGLTLVYKQVEGLEFFGFLVGEKRREGFSVCGGFRMKKIAQEKRGRCNSRNGGISLVEFWRFGMVYLSGTREFICKRSDRTRRLVRPLNTPSMHKKKYEKELEYDLFFFIF